MRERDYSNHVCRSMFAYKAFIRILVAWFLVIYNEFSINSCDKKAFEFRYCGYEFCIGDIACVHNENKSIKRKKCKLCDDRNVVT